MKCPKCGFIQADGLKECAKCGVIFSRIKSAAARSGPAQGAASWTDSLEVDDAAPPPPAGGASKEVRIKETPKSGPSGLGEYREFVRELLFQDDGVSGPHVQYARGVLWLMLLLAALKISFVPMEELSENGVINLLHLVNLPFHEAGHIIFTPFGRFMQVLGGSLLQAAIPLICAAGFLIAWRDPFASSVAWWWAGENFLDLAPYINDARAGEMILIGGITGRDDPDFHDWKNLLTWTGLLKYDHALANLAVFVGTAMMASALAWGIWIIVRGLRAREG